jgi:uncharacterized membrane protein
MTGSEVSIFSYWWIFPLLMFFFCIFMMRGRKCPMTCGSGSREEKDQDESSPNSAIDILEKRFALSEINREEFQEKKDALSHWNE